MTNIVPLKKPKGFIKHLILYCDFQTFVFDNQHYIGCYSVYSEDSKLCTTGSININDNASINKQFIEKISNDLLDEFIRECLNASSDEKIYIYFHDFARFEALFLLNYFCNKDYSDIQVISRENLFYEIKIKIGSTILVFRDSYLLFPHSLKKFAEVFNEQQIDFNHKNIKIEKYLDEEFLNYIYSYSENNAYILGLCFSKFRKLINEELSTDIVNYLTLSSLAFSIYRYRYLKENHIQISYQEMDKFVRESYKGGVVDVYKPLLENGYYYDVNSLYPYVMANFNMPVGKPIKNWVKNSVSFDINNFFGFIYVKVKCPKDLYIPFLTVMHDDLGLISPTGMWEGVYFSEEIKYALTLGYTFEYFEYYAFDKAIIFEEYVSDMYKKRLEFKEKPALSTIYKLLLNSLYGRFGMTSSAFKNIFIKDDAIGRKKLSDIALTYDYSIVSNFDNNLKLIRYNDIACPRRWYHLKDLNKINDTFYEKTMHECYHRSRRINIAVHIASAITAYARIHMHKLKMKYVDNLYYSDTDSLITDIELDDNLVSDTQIGLFKLEYKIKRAIFIAPKLYYMELENETIIKAKGVNPELLIYDDFLKLYNSECIEISTVIKFLRNLNKYTIGIKEVDVSISGSLKKRVKVLKNNKWIDTKPINLYE
jgi:hypothetical protein